MSVAKKRKVDSECRVFKEEWTTKYFFTNIGQKAVCLICQESIAVFKDYNLSRHFSSKHSNYGVNLSPAEKANKYKMVILRHKDLHAYGKICETVHKTATANKICKRKRSFVKV